MVDLWVRDTWIAALITISAVFLVLPIQLVLCFKAKKRLIKLLPMAVFAVATIVFYIMMLTAKEWSALVYVILAVFFGVLLLFSGIAWGIWAVVRLVKKKNRNISNQTYSLRRVTEDDYDFIYQVKKDAYKKYVEMCFGSWDEEQQKEYFRKFIETYKEGAFIISFDGKEIGFYNGCATENTYEIGNICIVPEYQNRGIGTAVLKDVLAENAGKKITLQYFKQNPVGRLYESLGFRLLGETQFHYQMIKEV